MCIEIKTLVASVISAFGTGFGIGFGVGKYLRRKEPYRSTVKKPCPIYDEHHPSSRRRRYFTVELADYKPQTNNCPHLRGTDCELTGQSCILLKSPM